MASAIYYSYSTVDPLDVVRLWFILHTSHSYPSTALTQVHQHCCYFLNMIEHDLCLAIANIVEAATLASAKPPAPTYKPTLPPACTENKEDSLLSTLQYVRRCFPLNWESVFIYASSLQETVVMVGQRHDKMLANQTRAGYFCGDGTGVGKGRQIAAIIAGTADKE